MSEPTRTYTVVLKDDPYHFCRRITSLIFVFDRVTLPIRSGDDLRKAGLHWRGAAFGQLQTQSRHPLQNRDEGDLRRFPSCPSSDQSGDVKTLVEVHKLQNSKSPPRSSHFIRRLVPGKFYHGNSALADLVAVRTSQHEQHNGHLKRDAITILN